MLSYQFLGGTTILGSECFLTRQSTTHSHFVTPPNKTPTLHSRKRQFSEDYSNTYQAFFKRQRVETKPSIEQPPSIKQPVSKRKRLEEKPTVNQPVVKRRRLEGKSHNQTPSSFLDNLSQVQLTSTAVEVFDQRSESLAALPRSSSYNLTKVNSKQLKRFAKHGGPNLSGLRGSSTLHKVVHSVNSTETMAQNQSQLSTGIVNPSVKPLKGTKYDGNFETLLKGNAIYFNNHDLKPGNLAEINQRLLRPCASLELPHFSEDSFRDFVLASEAADVEKDVKQRVKPQLVGSDGSFQTYSNGAFNNLADLGLNNLPDGVKLPKPQPDHYDGASAWDLNLRVRKNLGTYIVPSSTNKMRPCLPSFFLEAQAPGADMKATSRQVCYYGIFGARGVHELRKFIDPETVFDNNAYTITASYCDGTIKLYTVHTTPSNTPDIPLEYRMTLVDNFYVTKDIESFRKGVGALRNAREWAREKREELIEAANRKDNSMPRSPYETAAIY